MRASRIAWTPEQLAFIKRRQGKLRSIVYAEFVKRFPDASVSLDALCSLCKRNGWLAAPRIGRMKGHSTAFSKDELAYISRRRKLSRAELHALFVAKFEREDVSFQNFHNLFKRRGWRNGRDGRIKPGSVPPNKGKKMPFNASSARTQFKKGAPRSGKAAEVYKPIGTERMSGGYLVRKIHDGMPLQSRWRAVHLLNWEAINGPIAKDMRLKCKGDRLNTDPSNWELIPVGVLPRLNNQWGRNYDQAPGELKPTIMAVAKLEHAVAERRKAS